MDKPFKMRLYSAFSIIIINIAKQKNFVYIFEIEIENEN